MRLNRKASQCAIELIKHFEGCPLSAYKDAKGILTVGYGHTAGVYAGQKITQEQAEDFLKSDISIFENLVNKYDSVYKFTQNEFDSLVSFAFNMGNISKLTNNGKRTKKEIVAKILAYNTCKGKVLKGLTTRRKKEQEIFLNPSGWVRVGKLWFYYENGVLICSNWILESNGNWYYLTADGRMATYCYIKAKGKNLYYWVNSAGEYEEKWDTETPNLEMYKLVI